MVHNVMELKTAVFMQGKVESDEKLIALNKSKNNFIMRHR